MLVALIATLLTQAPDAGAGEPVLPELVRLSKQLEPKLRSPWVKRWAQQISTLEHVERTTWYCTKDRQHCQSEAPDAGGFDQRTVDDEYVYARIADPLGYARAFELLAQMGFDPKGRKVLDFGYGSIGQLLMLARLGVDVHGVEIDSLIPLSSARFVGKVGAGSLTLHNGYFAGDQKLVGEMGGGYALWLSKNTLKRGYVHPAEPKDAKAQIDLGAADAKVLSTIAGQLARGGYFFIYNLAPAQAVPYKPMADGRCPFSRESLAAAGFEVLGFDVDDSAAAREMGRALEWDHGDEGLTSNLDESLFATWTLARKR